MRSPSRWWRSTGSPRSPCRKPVIIGLGAISATGSPNLAVLAGSATAGGKAGDRASYYVGRKASGRIRNGKPATAKEKAEQALLRQGSAAIVIGRFIPYGRTATTLTAGSGHNVPTGEAGLRNDAAGGLRATALSGHHHVGHDRMPS